jgi:hypothetical protein
MREEWSNTCDPCGYRFRIGSHDRDRTLRLAFDKLQARSGHSSLARRSGLLFVTPTAIQTQKPHVALIMLELGWGTLNEVPPQYKIPNTHDSQQLEKECCVSLGTWYFGNNFLTKVVACHS